MTYWDDTGFILNGTYIAVWLQHPRLAYDDAVDDLAHAANPPYEDKTSLNDLFSDAGKIYKKVGKSGKRKKVIAYKTNRLNNDDFMVWYHAVKVKKAKIAETSDLEIKPSFKVESLSWCRGVSICAPMEIRGVNDLRNLVKLVKDILLCKTNIQKEFPDYVYNKANWIAEKSLKNNEE